MGKMEMSKGKAIKEGRHGRPSRITEREMKRFCNPPRRKNWIHFLRQTEVRVLHPPFLAWLNEQRFGKTGWRYFTRLPFSLRLHGDGDESAI